MPNNPAEYIANVIPLTRIPLARTQAFSYLSDKKLPAGTLVRIIFSGRMLRGIAAAASNSTSKKTSGLKKISGVIQKRFLTKQQLALARWMSDYYLSPLGIVLGQFVPKIAKTRGKDKLSFVPLPEKSIILTSAQREAAAKIISSQKREFLLYGPSSSGKTEVYIEVIKKILEKNRNSQILVLLPELSLTPHAIQRYGSALGFEKLAILHSKVAKGRFYQRWQAIKAGEARVIIATRQGVFAPFKNLKLIIIDEEQEISFKQWDMNPRYDARTTAEQLACIWQARIVFGGATPSIEMFYRARQESITILELPRLNIKRVLTAPLPRVTIVDMLRERWSKNRSPLSRLLLYEIKTALKNKQQTLLFINRRGMSNYTICTQCSHVLRCPHCDRALVYDNRGIYSCLHCNFKTSALIACPNCKQLHLRNTGAGTQKIEREIKKHFPDATVRRADFDTTQRISSWQTIFEQFSRRQIDILIGTQMTTKGWDFPNLRLVGILDADALFRIPDFKTTERGFFHILQAAGRTSRPGSNSRGRVIIQTFNPESELIKYAAGFNYEAFYKKEIEERDATRNPPFWKFLLLFLQHAYLEKVDKESQSVYTKLTKVDSKRVIISEPYFPLSPKTRGKWRKHILLRLPYRSNIPTKISKVIVSLSADWRIDVDPISII